MRAGPIRHWRMWGKRGWSRSRQIHPAGAGETPPIEITMVGDVDGGTGDPSPWPRPSGALPPAIRSVGEVPSPEGQRKLKFSFPAPTTASTGGASVSRRTRRSGGRGDRTGKPRTSTRIFRIRRAARSGDGHPGKSHPAWSINWRVKGRGRHLFAIGDRRGAVAHLPRLWLPNRRLCGNPALEKTTQLFYTTRSSR